MAFSTVSSFAFSAEKVTVCASVLALGVSEQASRRNAVNLITRIVLVKTLLAKQGVVSNVITLACLGVTCFV